MIITMILMGICMGAQPLLSYNYGAGNMRKLAGVIQRLIILFVNAGVIMAGLVIVLKKPVISLFLKDTAVAVMAEQILSIVMISSPFMGFFYLATNFLQAVGHAAKATLISSLQKGILLIPALFLFEWILGYVGIRMAYVVADFMAIIFSSLVMLIEWKKLSHATEGKKDKNGG